MHFTRAWGFTGLTVVNLYPIRTPHPAHCRHWAQSEMAQAAIRTNARIVAREAKYAAMIVAAWGGNVWDVDWHEAIIAAILANSKPRREIHCLGTTKAGDPKHPLARGRHRIADDQRPVVWRGRLS
jgi:hypothetical protein